MPEQETPQQPPTLQSARTSAQRLMQMAVVRWNSGISLVESGIVLAFMLAALADGGDFTMTAIYLVAAWIVASIRLLTAKEIGMRWRFAGVAAITVLLFACGTFVQIHNAKPKAPPHAPATNPLDDTVKLECQWSQLPATVPPNGLYEIEVTTREGALVSSSFQPGSAANWGTTAPTYANRCRFTNYGPLPVLKAFAIFSFQLREVLKEENGTRSGKIVNRFDAWTPVADLGSGSNGTFDFYVRNYTPYWVDGTIPVAAYLQTVGSDKRQTVKLIPPQMSSFFLMPFDRQAQPLAPKPPKHATRAIRKAKPEQPAESVPRPSDVTTAATSTPPSVPSALKRLIAYDDLRLLIEPWDGKIGFLGFDYRVNNVGTDTLSISTAFAKVYLDGTLVLTCGPPPMASIVPQTQGMPIRCRMAGGAHLQVQPSLKESVVEIEEDYDTIPSTGVRRSYRKLQFTLSWANGPNNSPLASDPATIDAWEK